jgi:hypothetical protein
MNCSYACVAKKNSDITHVLWAPFRMNSTNKEISHSTKMVNRLPRDYRWRRFNKYQLIWYLYLLLD